MKLLGITLMLLLPVFAGQNGINGQARSADDISSTNKAYTNELSKAFYSSNAINEMVDSIYQLMSLEERAAQMIMVASSASNAEFQQVKNNVAGRIAGSVLLLKGSKQGFQQQVRTLSGKFGEAILSPFFACDCEPSLLHRKWEGAPMLTPAGEQETDELVVNTTKDIAAEMQEMGATLNFAPVADNGSNRAIIGNRAFGTTGNEIYPKASLFVNTLQSEGIAATIKHFPGHGSVKGDSHKAAVYIDGPLTELETFRKIIKTQDPLVVMVGHITIRKNELYQTSGFPSSISRNIVTGLLREKLGFNGIIATDAMNMKAVAQFKDADWKAVQAGADLVVMPLNATKLNARIVAALQSDTPIKDQVEQSIKRIIKLKLVTNGDIV